MGHGFNPRTGRFGPDELPPFGEAMSCAGAAVVVGLIGGAVFAAILAVRIGFGILLGG